MKKNFLIRFIVIFVLSFNLNLLAYELFFMPQDGKDALKTLLKSIDLSTKSIDIAIYSFTHKDIAKRLQNASKRGVKVTILFDEESNNDKNENSQIGYLAKIKNIDVRVIKGRASKNNRYFGKMHNKFMIVDDKKVLFGSINWSYSGFNKNYENLYIEEDYQLAKKFKSYFDKMYKESNSY
jgi:phosphatidylserine/phosphatidylglycerophosphate/cardiolipin synthase-like enzyme